MASVASISGTRNKMRPEIRQSEVVPAATQEAEISTSLGTRTASQRRDSILPEVGLAVGQTLRDVRGVLVVHQSSFLYQVLPSVSQCYLELI